MNTHTRNQKKVFKIRIYLRIFCFLLCCHIKAGAQTISLSDTLRSLIHQKPVFTGKWDTQNSFITGKSIEIQSIKAGVVFGDNLTLGLGYHWINSRNFQDYVLDGFRDSSPIRMRYFSLFGEFVYFKKNHWQGVIPVQLGVGKSYLFNEKNKLFKGTVLLYEPSITIEYKWSPWIAIGAGYGYRIMLKNNRNIDQNFYAPIYVFRVRLLFDEWYKKYVELINAHSD